MADGTFDGALTLHSSLGYTGEDADRSVLREIRRVLRPGGRLVIETNHRDRLPPRSPWREWYPLGDGAVLLAESRVDRVAGTVELVHTYMPASGPAETRTIRWRAYSATELVRILADAGFGEIACYGNLDGGAFGGRHASRPRGDRARNAMSGLGHMTPNVALETPRLVLREFADDDATPVHAYAADAEVVRHLDWGPNAPEDTAGFLALARAARDAVPRTAYHLAIVLKTADRLVGGCRIEVRSAANGSGDLGYVLDRRHWGQGYATEATRALVDFGFEPPGAPPDLGHLRRRQPRVGAGPREARHAERRSSPAERPAEGRVARLVPLRHPRAGVAARSASSIAAGPKHRTSDPKTRPLRMPRIARRDHGRTTGCGRSARRGAPGARLPRTPRRRTRRPRSRAPRTPRRGSASSTPRRARPPPGSRPGAGR